MKSVFTMLLAVLAATSASGNARLQTHPVLQAYIQQALDSNLVLRQKTIGLQQSLLALAEAKSLFLPAINFGATYSLAGGGRQIAIPIGDLLNPVYQTLNQLTGSQKFPTISNTSENFLPNNFYDARIRTTYPLLNPDLRANQNIRQIQVALSQAEIDIYKLELIKEIKTAYYQYLSATAAVNIYQSASVLAERGLKVNESLYKNGKGLPAYISRSQAQLLQTQAQINAAANDRANARAWFNFLLNKPLTDSITVIEPEMDTLEYLVAEPEREALVLQRQEVGQLKRLAQLQQVQLTMAQNFKKPRLNAFADLGSQAFNFKVNGQSAYYMIGLQLEVPIFAGRKNLIKIDQARTQLAQTQVQQQYLNQQLNLAAYKAGNQVNTQYQNLQAAARQVAAAQAYYKLIDRGLTEGINSFIEWLDAQNQLTTALIQQQLVKYQTLTALAELERQLGNADYTTVQK